MKVRLYTFYTFIISLINIFVLTKSLYEREFKSRDDSDMKSYPIKRKIPVYEQGYYLVPREQSNAGYSHMLHSLGDQVDARYRRLEKNGSPDQLQINKNYKENPSFVERQAMKRYNKWYADRLYKRDVGDLVEYSEKEPYGVVYRKGKVLGVLRPYPEMYELTFLSNTEKGNEYLPKRYTGNSDLTEALEKRGTNDDKYPMILADFKIDSKISNNLNKRDDSKSMLSGKGATKNKMQLASVQSRNENVRKSDNEENERASSEINLDSSQKGLKRNYDGITDEKIAELESTLHQIRNSESDNVDTAEDSLRGILSDMGLIKSSLPFANDNALDKRETNGEDENLEEGENKIDIMKATTHTENADRYKRDGEENLPTNKVSTVEDEVGSEAAKRADDGTSSKTDLNLFIKDKLEKKKENNHKRDSSTVTVLNYQNEGDAYIRSKRHQETSTETNEILRGLENSGDLTVSGNKSPLASSVNHAEVRGSSTTQSDAEKREASDLDDQKQLEKNIQRKIDAIKDEVKREIEELRAKRQRQKRAAVNNLLEEESSDVDPQEHPEEKLVPYVRVRRNLNQGDIFKRQKRGLQEYSDMRPFGIDDYSDWQGYNEDLMVGSASVDSDTDDNLENAKLNDDFQEQSDRSSIRDVSASDATTVLSVSKFYTVLTPELFTKSVLSTINTSQKYKNPTQMNSEDVSENLMLMLKNSDNLGEDKNTNEINQIDKPNANEIEVQNQDKKREVDKDDFDVESQTNAAQIYKEDDSMRSLKDASPKIDEYNFYQDDEIRAAPESFRKRRQIGKTNRNNPDVLFRTYPDEQEEFVAGDDENELYDDGFDNFNPNVQKRETPVDEYESFGENVDDNLSSNYYLNNQEENDRSKRQDFNQLVAVHGGGTVLNHLAAARERNAQQLENDSREKRYNTRTNNLDNKNEPQNIAELSDTDLFGALPQNYDGELTRYKRVKREMIKNKRKQHAIT